MLQGWVYVMVNVSMRNMVKVGRTTREPRLRVAELSSATGVPTPFVLEFGQIYADCARAEREIHETLDQRGLRVRANREFFHGPAQDIVRIIMAHACQYSSPPLPGGGGGASARRLAWREQLDARARQGDPFSYAESAMLSAEDGDAAACLGAWDLFFAARQAAGASPVPDDRRMIAACRRYIACCLALGQVPGHRTQLLRVSDDILDQQAVDLRRLRGTPSAARLSAVMRWTYQNLAEGDAGPPGANAAARRGPRAGQREAA